MGRRGHSFLDHWHRQCLDLPDGATLRWVLISTPGRAPQAECFRLTAPDGTSRGVHVTEALRLLADAGHPDATHVSLETHVGQSLTH